MIGRGAIAQGAITQSSVGNAQRVPLLGAVAVVAYAPDLIAGAAIEIPVLATIAVTAGVCNIVESATLAPDVLGTILVTANAPELTGAGLYPTSFTVAVTAPAPSLAAGKRVQPGVTGIAVTAPSPGIFAGKSVFVPLASAVVAAELPHVSISATVAPDALGAVSVTAAEPDIRSGSRVAVPANAVGLEALLPALASGTRIDVPAQVVAAAFGTPSPRAGASVASVTADAIVVAAYAPNVIAGTAIMVGNTTIRQLPVGGIASESIAQYAIANGDRQSRTYVLPPQISVNTHPPLVYTGSHISVPAATIGLTFPIPDTQARPRRVWLTAIAS